MKKISIESFIITFLCICLLPQGTKAQKVKKDRLNYNAFCFYYNWHGNPKHDVSYVHWAHPVMKANSSDTTSGYFPGDDNIASNFYPALGTYSNNDPEVIKRHMQMIAKSGIGTIVLTWWGKAHFTAKSVQLIMDEANKKGIKVSFHIEPYGGRTAKRTREEIEYLVDNYGNHPAFYRSAAYGKKPFFFIYDSYLTKAEEWATLLQSNDSTSIRNTRYDGVMIGLWLSESAKSFIHTSGFDGFYTYFASSGFTPGSTPSNWKGMYEWAVENNKIFIPCVGPGYIDTRVRPWNDRNTKDRNNGNYYDQMFSKAIESNAPFIGITSFNEWHEGTQIEPAMPFSSPAFNYLDYAPLQPDHYLNRTKHWLNVFTNSQQSPVIDKHNSVRVMSYNIHHCNPPEKPGQIDIDAVANTIRSAQPDIVALQEVDVLTKRSGNINQAQLIAEKTGLNLSFGKAIDFEGGEYGIAILSKYSMSEFEVFNLPGDSSTRGEPRILVTAKIRMPSGQVVRFGNTHLDSQKDPVNREMQVKEILKIASKERGLFIIAGDFNAPPGSNIIKKLDKYFTRTCEDCEPTIPAVKPEKAIDFIGFSDKKRIRVLSHKVIQDSYSSDHLPVLATLQFIESSPTK